MNIVNHLPKLPKGTYILILYLHNSRGIQIGKLGNFEFPAGYYSYIGSAFGPGGLTGRLKHHLQPSIHPHWHIDYLRKEAVLKEICYTEEPVPLEHNWAKILQSQAGIFIPVAGFGASDCHCQSHLFYSPEKNTLSHSRDFIGTILPGEFQLQFLSNQFEKGVPL